MALRLRIRTAQPLPAPRAPLRLEVNDVIDLLNRQELTRMPLMSGFTATLASLRLARWLRVVRRGIRRRRTRGVRGVLPEALTQFGDLGLEVIDLCDLLTKCGELLLVSGEADAHQAHLLLKC